VNIQSTRKAPVQHTGRSKDVYRDPRPWSKQFSVATVKAREGDTLTLSGVRWGYEEVGPAEEWEPRFRDTRIDLSKLTDVYVGMEPMMNVGHSTLIFEFSEPVQTTDGAEQDDKLVVSVEARRREGQPYKFWHGFGKDFGLIYQVGSFGDRVQHTARKIGRSQELRRLELTEQQKRDLLELSMQESVKDRTGDYYHTTRDSCYSGTIKQLDQVLEGGMKKWAIPGLVLKPTMVAPSLTALAFEDRGLLADEPCLVVQPDQTLHPGTERKETRWLDPAVDRLSKDHPTLWKRAFQVTGAAAGALLAGQLGGGLIAGVAAATVGAGTAGVLADHLRLSAGHEYLEPDQFFPSSVESKALTDL